MAIEFLGQWVSRLIYLSLLAGFLELLLPAEGLRRLLRLTAGLLLLSVLLQPLVGLLQERAFALPYDLALPQSAATDNTALLEQQQFRELYRKRLEQQLAAELATNGQNGCIVRAELSAAAGEPTVSRLSISGLTGQTAAGMAAELAKRYNISAEAVEIHVEGAVSR